MVFCILLCGSINVAYGQESVDSEKEKLSELSAEECIQFIISNGVNVSDGYLEKETFGEFVKTIIFSIERNPRWVNSFNLVSTYELAEEIREVVNDYYGNMDYMGLSLMSAVALTDSQYVLPWSSGYPSYNCYGYAIKVYNGGTFDPGFKINTPVTEKTDAQTIAAMSGYDLRTLGYSAARYSATRPSSIGSGETLICVRRGEYDYHFMRCMGTYWNNKPGQTAVLKYKYEPSYSRQWINEAVIIVVLIAVLIGKSRDNSAENESNDTTKKMWKMKRQQIKKLMTKIYSFQI